MSHSASPIAERTPEAAASSRRAGSVLSFIGAVLALVALAIVIGGGFLLTSQASGHPMTAVLRWIAGMTKTAVPEVLVLFAVCALIPGEQLRRGGMGRNLRPPKTLLPNASRVSEFTVVSAGWRMLWIIIGLVASAFLIGVPTASWFHGGWPASLAAQYDFSSYWLIFGSLAAGATAAAIVSLVKKSVFERVVRSGRKLGGDSVPGGQFWRWFDFRWRFDLWLGGAGGVMLGISPQLLQGAVGPEGASYRLQEALPGFVVLVGVGAVFFVAGIVASTQFWKAGVSLGSGESFS